MFPERWIVCSDHQRVSLDVWVLSHPDIVCFCCLITWQSTTTTVPVVQAVAQGVRLECSTSFPTRLTGSKFMTKKLFVTFNKEMVMGQNRAGSLAHHPSIV